MRLILNERIIGIGNGTTGDGTVLMTSNDQTTGIFTSAASSDPRYSAVFEDNGSVAYGYMLLDKRIIGDVWLYNRGDAPSRRPWIDRTRKPPFANPAEFVAPGSFVPVSVSEDVSFRWLFGEDDRPLAAEIWIRGELHARVAPGAKPGWCRLAAKNGPLALCLD
jgi:hypothetical protein